jgi:hypothetical protein
MDLLFRFHNSVSANGEHKADIDPIDEIAERGIQKLWQRGGTVVKVLCYKSEGRWFDFRWCHGNFSLT